MTTRDDFAVLLRRHERRMNAERRELAERAVAIIQRHGQRRERFDTLAYALTMREIDALLGEFYGQWPGDRRARFWRLTLDECRAARALAWLRSRQLAERFLPASLIRAIREAA